MYDLCIIGFGISGISCSKIAKNKKLNYLVLEKNNNFGGCWNSRAFKWTRLQTHKKFYEFPDFKNVLKSDYPNKSELLDYFNLYIKNNKLDKNVKYNHEVLKTVYKNNEWNIIYKNNNTVKYIKSKYLAVCSGLFSEKNIPDLIKKKHNIYDGEIFHSEDIINRNINFKIFNNKNILIIGNGASSTDIVRGIIEKKIKYKDIYILHRSSKWFVKRYVWGISISIVISKYILKITKHLNKNIFILFFSFFLKVIFNNKLDFPKEKVKYNNLVADDYLIDYINNGKINYIKGVLVDIKSKKVTYKKKSKVNILEKKDFDYIICATGYKQTIPFLNIYNQQTNYKHIINPNIENCGFIGFNPSYNWIEVSYYQSLWFIENRLKLPNKKNMISCVNKLKDYKKKFNLEYIDLTYDSLNYISVLKKK